MNTAKIYKEEFENPAVWDSIIRELGLSSDTDEITIKVVSHSKSKRGQPQESTFQQWYEENKHNDSVQRLYRGVVENDPDYPLTFAEWCKKYYQECVDV